MGQLNLKQQTSSFLPPTQASSKGVLQRKCSCGNHTNGGECEECSKKKVQRKLSIGATNDPLEQEADRVAEQVVGGCPGHNFQSARPSIQRAPTPDLDSTTDEGERDAVPDSVEQTLTETGRPLAGPLRRDMESRFGRDFSQVHLHTGALADRSTKEVDARAYTVGNHVVFGQSQFNPNTRDGRLLLAHELTHVVQQGAGTNQVMRAPKKPAKSKDSKAKDDKKGKPDKSKIPQVCGRNSRKVKGNFITKVTLDVGAHTLKITWDDPATEPPLSKGTHKISPGTGKCCKDCNDETTSQTSGSLCTPKGDEWEVSNRGCALGGHPTAKNPTYFQRPGVAIHSGNVSSPPASHGCARTSPAISELIHDNVVEKKTKVASSGTWKGSRCFMKEPDAVAVERSSVCDGNKLKPPKPKKSPPKNDKKKDGRQKGKDTKAKPRNNSAAVPEPKSPVADLPSITDLPDIDEPLMREDPSLAIDESVADGPGPDNATADASGPSEGSLDDLKLEPDPDTENEIA